MRAWEQDIPYQQGPDSTSKGHVPNILAIGFARIGCVFILNYTLQSSVWLCFVLVLDKWGLSYVNLKAILAWLLYASRRFIIFISDRRLHRSSH